MPDKKLSTDLSVTDQLKKTLEELSLQQLILESRTNDHLLDLCKNVTQKRFTEKHFKIISPFVAYTSSENYTKETKDFVETQHFDTAVEVLQIFGKSISKITVEYNRPDNDPEADTINKLINSQCADTLIEFDVTNQKSFFFRDISKPFTNVQKLSLKGSFENLVSPNASLDDLFPSLTHLTLNHISVKSTIGLDNKYSRLEQLDVSIFLAKRWGSLTEEFIVSLLKKNSQIRRLGLSGVSPFILSAAAEELPTLEELSIDFYFENQKDGKPYNATPKQIHFSTVKKFKMTGSSHSIPANIHFPNLIEFHTNTFPRDCPRWINFIETNNNLQKLVIYGQNLNQTIFSRIAAAKLNLIEISAEVAFDVKDALIVKLIKNNKNLQKFYLKFISDDLATATKDTLEEELGKEWRVEQYSNTLTLSKIVNDPNNANAFKVNVYIVFLFVSYLAVSNINRH